jgi:quercetin dioxygenase-like cupin family protein
MAPSDIGEGTEVIWRRQSDIPAFSPAPGIRVQPVIGESLMTCWIDMDPAAVVAEHSHPNEQLGVVVAGSIEITVGGETRTLEVGDAYAVAPDRLHRGVAGPDGVVLVETFVPVREDYRRMWEDVAQRKRGC